MRFLEINEIWAWCAERGVALEDGARPAPDSALTHRSRMHYADGGRSGRETAVAAACVRALGHWDECLLWVTQVGVWASTEDWPRYYQARGAHGERRSIEAAPGHWFGAEERTVLTEFLTMVLENGWDAHLLPARAGVSTDARAHVSHDEWVELHTASPVNFSVPAG
jgi:hypothetical protein